eukprot:6489817-Amphidinium_carterae.3
MAVCLRLSDDVPSCGRGCAGGLEAREFSVGLHWMWKCLLYDLSAVHDPMCSFGRHPRKQLWAIRCAALSVGGAAGCGTEL